MAAPGFEPRTSDMRGESVTPLLHQRTLDASEFSRLNRRTCSRLSVMRFIEKRTTHPPGYLILGGLDPSFHVGKLFYVDVNAYDSQFWTVMVDGFQVGESEFVEDNTFAVIDSGSPWIQISPDSLKEIHQIVKPIRYSDGFHFVDCSTMLQLPVIDFHLSGGQRLSLEPEYYVFKDEWRCVRTDDTVDQAPMAKRLIAQRPPLEANQNSYILHSVIRIDKNHMSLPFYPYTVSEMRLTWNPADFSRQLIRLHQAASGSNYYDIRDIAIHCEKSQTRDLAGFKNHRKPSQASRFFFMRWCEGDHHKRGMQLGFRFYQTPNTNYIPCSYSNDPTGLKQTSRYKIPRELSDTAVSNVLIGNVQQECGEKCSSLPFDGIIGLCYDSVINGLDPKLLDQLLVNDVIETLLFSLWLNPFRNPRILVNHIEKYRPTGLPPQNLETGQNDPDIS
ncbi:plasmepsin-2 [Clonorchis sinensis]|uniref:Plasmepsin-2 n=1 Tax=Clonorchis sinensis TaxID=79923 RepID=A0A8T1N109_CLOSI|nr:plasmepsin-2 [Clonorchis sinensis]